MTDKIFLSNKFKVSAIENNSETNVPVHIALICNGDSTYVKLPDEIYKEYDGLEYGTNTVKTNYATFEFEENVSVVVDLPINTKTVTIKPQKYADKCVFENGRLTFNTSTTRFICIQPDGDIFGSLHIFCNKKKTVCNSYKNIIEFTNGVYTSENCEYIRQDEHGTPVLYGITDDTYIHIADGAVVNAAIELKGVKNVHIGGHGIISLIDRCSGAENNFSDDVMWGGFRYYARPNIHIRSGCKNIKIDGVLLNCEFRGIVIRNSENIEISNVKIFTSCINADGINCYNTRNMKVSGCYIMSEDDCFCMYNACDSIPTLFDDGYDDVKSVCRNVEVSNCIMSSNARPVVLGGHATSETEPRCIIENITIHHCDIIETPNRIFGNEYEHAKYWSGFFRLLSQSEQIVRNIVFEDITINVTKGCMGKVVHIDVRDGKDSSYTENQGYRIENILFRNIFVRNNIEGLMPSIIKCRAPKNKNDKTCVSNVIFDNVTFNEKEMEKTMLTMEGTVDNVKIIG